jgi:hypothetical protein
LVTYIDNKLKIYWFFNKVKALLFKIYILSEERWNIYFNVNKILYILV